MARNEEKHFCNLNRLVLLKEKEEYEKAHPPRPRLNTLDTPEDIQKWLPSIKRDIDFYLKKSQVICYSDAHVDECREKVVKLEKEFKAFVRKIKQLSPSPSDVIPWTSRPYKRKKTNITGETPFKEFKRIATPILDDEKNNFLFVPCEDSVCPSQLYTKETSSSSVLKLDNVTQYDKVNWNVMDQPLIFSSVSINQKELDEASKTNINLNISNLGIKSCDSKNSRAKQSEIGEKTVEINKPLFNETVQHHKIDQTINSIVNYDSSGDENS